MPSYDYYCELNGETVEATHSIKASISNWGELCYVTQYPLGETDPLAPVRKLIRPPAIAFPTGNAELKNHGFTKLVKRDDGVYENMTAVDDEKRYMKAGDPSSIPNLKKKIED
ncbi:MAG: zinc ribbon domain-containing protein [Proteobacteria bacterium]|nr:zinc ribbon domain-containing protein [Pseudomonadota bacterium]